MSDLQTVNPNLDSYVQEIPSTPAQRISSDAQAIAVAKELAISFAVEAAQRDRDRRLPIAELTAFSQSGLWGITVPKAYGGAEVSYRTLAEVLKIIAAVDPSLAQLPQNHLVVIDHLRLDGSEAQKNSFFCASVMPSPSATAVPWRISKPC